MENTISEMLEQAKLEVEVAENHLDWAKTPEDVDICIYRLNSAERYLDKVIRLAKENMKHGN